MHLESHGAPQTAPKAWGSSRVKVWHDDEQVSAITGQSLLPLDSPPMDVAGTIIWFVAKHGTGNKGILYQSTRVGGETSTDAVLQEDSECYVSPGCGLSSEKADNGPVVAWITADGAVMTLQQDWKAENDPLFNQIAPAGSAALNSTVCLSGGTIWWFGPNWELMGAYSSKRFDSTIAWNDLEWTVWQQLPAGVGRKGKDSIVSAESRETIWYAGADDMAHSLSIDRY
ncbi:hypothetical protein TWF481_008900 [Arthrobotrys musiformis]|uniref:Fucose-specific lectin n=1 Tax=Arthrobotrys musiformis TaxID=47236 RepID=A0AAV9W8K6_9PEZI